jgi:hypothetical protein
MIASTVDDHIVFYNQKELSYYNKMQLRRLINNRKSEYIVNVNEKIEGFIMDSWNK